MSDLTKYKNFGVEKDARDAEKAREIVQEILEFGVTQSQILIIINQLALNLENVNHMKQLTQTVRNLDSSAFIIDRAELEE